MASSHEAKVTYLKSYDIVEGVCRDGDFTVVVPVRGKSKRAIDKATVEANAQIEVHHRRRGVKS